MTPLSSFRRHYSDPLDIRESTVADFMGPASREHACESCGARYLQRQLAERWLSWVERLSPRGLLEIQRQCPDFWLPVYCPSCERSALTGSLRPPRPQRDWTEPAR